MNRQIKQDLPGRLNPDEIGDLMAEVASSLRQWSRSQMFAGCVEVAADGTINSHIGAVGFSPVHWLVLAHSALEKASLQFRASNEIQATKLAERIDAAMMMLDLEERAQH